MKKPIVIKIGGNDLSKPGFISAVVDSVARIILSEPCILVHGGGRTVDQLLDKLGIVPQYAEGQRITDAATLDVVEMVLSGQVNKEIVLAFLSAGVDALGISGVDRGLMRAELINGLGLVGRIVQVRGDVLIDYCAQGVVAVISPISVGPEGRCNVNADVAAGAIAGAVGASRTVFVSNVPGVYVGEKLAPMLTAAEIHSLIADRTISGGMIPKVQAALGALAAGVPTAVITDLAGLSAGTGTQICA